jgi:hypothetical protein
MFRFKDQSEVVLFSDYIPRYNGMDIFITLPNEKHRRQIGRVNFENRILYIQRDSVKESYKNSYGINLYVLSNGKKFDKVTIIEIDTNKIYCVETQFILKEGLFLIPSQEGVKKQIFITREWLSYYEVKPGEYKNLLIQQSKSIA